LVVGELKSGADQTKVDADDGGGNATQPGRYQRARCCASHHADTRRHRHVRTHQNTGQDEQPEQFVSMGGADLGADEQTARPEHHAGRD